MSNAARPIPNLDVYDFETQFETAIGDAFIAHGLPDASKQGDDKQLPTPRIEAKFVGNAQVQRSYIVPNTNPVWAYPNLWQGTLYLKLVTSRKKKEQNHCKIRALVRWIMQDHPTELTGRMKYLTVVQVLETGTQPSFDQNNEEDVSALSYSIQFNIKPSAFPTP